jgi:hypothetical protein
MSEAGDKLKAALSRHSESVQAALRTSQEIAASREAAIATGGEPRLPNSPSVEQSTEQETGQ